MRIVIPTRGRVGQIETIKHMSEEARSKVTLVVPPEEEKLHNFPDVAVFDGQGIAAKRKWIMKNIPSSDNKLVMMDDDLTFNVRIPGTVKLGVAKPEDIDNMIAKLESSLDDYVHAGVSMRLNNNRNPGLSARTARMVRVLAYRLDVVNTELDFDTGLEIAEDFDYTLQLLRKGYDNIVFYEWSQGHKGTNTKGGCSTWRTVEMHNENMKRLQQRHEGFVRLDEKSYEKTDPSMANRLEAFIFWKKAFKEGVEKYGAKPTTN